MSRCAIVSEVRPAVTAERGPLQVAGSGGPGLGRRLVEHDDQRVGEQHPGERELLGERRA